ENSSGKILIATSRFNFASRPRYTSPIPPLPSNAVISYEPSCCPMVIAMKVAPIITNPSEGLQELPLHSTAVNASILFLGYGPSFIAFRERFGDVTPEVVAPTTSQERVV